jgi:O-antigen ligase
MSPNSIHNRFSIFFAICIGAALVTTVAGTNIFVLLLMLTAPWAWRNFQYQELKNQSVQLFFALVFTICLWDVLSNLNAGHTLLDSSKALLHDMRTFGFILLLWPVFADGRVSRSALWALMGSFVLLATANLTLTYTGYVDPGKYFWPTAPHMYGQMLVGTFFVLAQMLLMRPALSWRCIVPMALLLASLFFASERRTGYLQLVAGALVWGGLNYQRLLSFKYRRWFFALIIIVLIAAIASPIVQRRFTAVGLEIQTFISQSSVERTAKDTPIGIRLQFYLSVWDLIRESNWWIGVGTINFPELFWRVNQRMGAVDPTLFSNPHNEYLYMLATKGIVGLVLYLGIFLQACRIAWNKKDELQRTGLLMFVFLFMLSIVTNSMMIDMEEGHFTMLILLIFLAPNTLNLIKQK